MGVLCLIFVLVCDYSSPYGFAIILTRKRELVALLQLYSCCLVTFNFLWLFLTVPWVSLQCVIVVFPKHTHSFFWVTVQQTGRFWNFNRLGGLGCFSGLGSLPSISGLQGELLYVKWTDR